MRIAVVNFMTLDGVIQSPLYAEEDPDDGFTAGGWTQPYMDRMVAHVMGEETTKAGGFLLGRRTYETFARDWSVADRREPAVAALNERPKYVASRSLTWCGWGNSHILGADPVGELTALKQRPGADLVVFGSSVLLATLQAADLVDRYTLLVFPVAVGRGKRMFAPDTSTTLTLRGGDHSPSGVAILRYSRK
jgi:dihydrofolate reductase